MENFYRQLRVSEIGIRIYRLIKRKIGLHLEWMKLIAFILNQWCRISELIKHWIINQELKTVNNLCSKNTIPSITSTQIPKISSKFIILLMSEWKEATIQLVLWTILVTCYLPKKVLPKLKRKEFLKITFSIEINLLRNLMNLKHKPLIIKKSKICSMKRSLRLRPKHLWRIIIKSQLSLLINVKGSLKVLSRLLHQWSTQEISSAKVVQDLLVKRKIVMWVQCSTTAIIARLRKVWIDMDLKALWCQRITSKRMSKKLKLVQAVKELFKSNIDSTLNEFLMINS